MHGIPSKLELNCYQGGVNFAKDKFLIFGGIDDGLVELSGRTYIYTHSTRNVERLGDMVTPRYGFTYQLMGDCLYVMAGGTTGAVEG